MYLNKSALTDIQLNSLKLSTPTSTRQTVIKPCSSYPTDQFQDKILKLIPKLHRDEFHQMILDKNLFPNFYKVETNVPVCKQFSWSPQGLNHLNRCLIAVVTDTGSCSIYVRSKLTFVLHKSISDDWVNICTKEWDTSKLDDFDDLQEKVRKINIQVIEWSHGVGERDKKAALLACAHENLEISLWRVETMAVNEKAPENLFLDILKPELQSDIKLMKWTRISDNQSILFISCLDGTVHGLNLEHDQKLNYCHFKSRFTVWDSADRILVMKIIALPCSNDSSEIMVVLSKGFHLVVLFVPLDQSVTMQPALVHKFPAQITGLESISNQRLLCALWNGAIHTISVNRESLSEDCIDKDISYTNYCCQGLANSRNSAFVVLFNSVSKFYDPSLLRQVSHYYVMALPKEISDPNSLIETALKSGSATISSIADCLASFRCGISFKGQEQLPEYLKNLENFHLQPDNNLQIHLQLIESLRGSDHLNCEKWVQLSNLIKTVLYARFFTRKKVTNAYAIFWLHKAVGSLDAGHSELIAASEKLLRSAANQNKAVCTVCNTDVTDVSFDHYTCSSGHKVPICTLSFQPCLTIPYCVCDGCGAIALHESVLSILASCVLCDGAFQFDLSILESNPSDGDKDNSESRPEEEGGSAKKKLKTEAEEQESGEGISS